MPEISLFFGLVIYMYFKNHAPPHFHAVYGNYEAQVSIETGYIISGEFPKKQERLVEAWAEIHKEELLTNYLEMQKDEPIVRKIKPLM